MGNWEGIWRGQGAKKLWSIPDRRVLELTAKWKESGTIHRVLDLGCGVGRHVHLLAGLGFETFGLDHSETGLETCGERLRETGLTADLRHSEMDVLPYADDFFDGVVAFNSIYHGTAAQVDAGVELIRKKLRVGGEFFATFLARDNRLYGRGEAIEEHTYLDPRMYKSLLSGEGENEVTHHFSSEDELRHFFRRYEIESLEHEELRLALPGKDGGAPSWLPIPRCYFWQIVARKVDDNAG